MMSCRASGPQIETGYRQQRCSCYGISSRQRLEEECLQETHLDCERGAEEAGHAAHDLLNAHGLQQQRGTRAPACAKTLACSQELTCKCQDPPMSCAKVAHTAVCSYTGMPRTELQHTPACASNADALREPLQSSCADSHVCFAFYICAKTKKGPALIADEVDGAAHVDVNKIHIQRVVQQLRAAPHGIRKAPTHLQNCS